MEIVFSKKETIKTLTQLIKLIKEDKVGEVSYHSINTWFP